MDANKCLDKHQYSTESIEKKLKKKKVEKWNAEVYDCHRRHQSDQEKWDQRSS